MPNRSTRSPGHEPGEFARIVRERREAAPVKLAAPTRFLVALALDSNKPSEDPALLVARLLQSQAPNVDGSVTRQLGFGAWGVEEGVQILSTTINGEELLAAVALILRTENQTAAYVEIDGEAFELRPDGELVAIEGFVA